MKKLIVKKYKDYKACFFVHFKESECYVKILNSNFYSKYSAKYHPRSNSGFLFISNTGGTMLIYLSRLSYLKKLNKKSFDIDDKDKLLLSIRKTDVLRDVDGEYFLKIIYEKNVKI